MQTYLNDSALKTAFLAEITKHEQADQIIKGTYGRMNGQWRGCAIGCSLHSLNILQGKPAEIETDAHARYESELGLPTWLAHLEDNIFENLPDAEAMTWPRRFADAIPVGAVVNDIVLAKILRWSLAAPKYGVRFATQDTEVVAVIDRMVELFDREIGGQAPLKMEWDEAAWAAWAAWAARAAWAAWAAWAARDARAARDGFYPALSNYVLELLRALPVA